MRVEEDLRSKEYERRVEVRKVRDGANVVEKKSCRLREERKKRERVMRQFNKSKGVSKIKEFNLNTQKTHTLALSSENILHSREIVINVSQSQ